MTAKIEGEGESTNGTEWDDFLGQFTFRQQPFGRTSIGEEQQHIYWGDIPPMAFTPNATTSMATTIQPVIPTYSLYRVHLIRRDDHSVVDDGLFVDYRIVAVSPQAAKERAIHTMGVEGMDLDDYAIVTELIGAVSL